MSPRFPHLAAPLRLGPIEIRNRMIMGPHQAQMGLSDGLPEQRYGEYLLARARGGAGLLIVEGGVVSPNSLREPTVLRAYLPEVVERWKPIVAAVKAQGVPIFGQLFHSGRQAKGYNNLDTPLWAPSAIACPGFREIPKEMELEDIDAVVEAYALGARHLDSSGFDGIEIQACHGYLLNEFLSPHTNKRTDEYGGSLENRMRILLRVLNRVRDVVGRTKVVGVRLGSTEVLKTGLDLEDGWLISQTLEQSQLIDYLSMSQGVRESQEFIRGPMFMKVAYAAEWTAAIKRELKLPVFVVGRMNDPAIAEKCVANGQADAVVLVRELIADPDYPRKTLEGRVDEIRRCCAISECLHNTAAGRPLTCAYNAEVGREGLDRLRRAVTPKRVVVVGAGPAGLEAARVGAARGHSVLLLERDQSVGGALRLAIRTPERGELQGILDYYTIQLEKLGVEIRLGCEATADGVLAEKPDVVLVATGAAPLLPPSELLPAIELEPGSNIISYEDVFSTAWKGTEHVVLVDGEYDAVAMGLADYLAERSVRVTFVTQAEQPGIRLDASTHKMWYRRLATRGVTLAPFRALAGAGPTGARLRHVHSGAMESVACEAIVCVLSRKARTGLYTALKARGADVRRIGDCLAPRTLVYAVHDGFETAAAL